MSHVLPGVYLTVSDGNLNLVSGSPTNTVLKLGVCVGGTVNVPVAYASQSQMVSALGVGSLVDNLALQFSYGGGPVLAMPVNASQAGSIGHGVASTLLAGTITPSAAPWTPIAIKITTGGALGSFAVAVGSGASYSAAVAIPAGNYSVPDTFTSIHFSDQGNSFVTNDVYTIGVDGYVTHTTGSGFGIITQTSSPVDNYNVQVLITTSGTTAGPGYPAFTYSLDGGSVVSPVIQLTSTNRYGIAGSGIALTFSGGAFSSTNADGYNFLTCGPTFSNGDLTTALAAIPNTLQYSMLEVVNGAMPASAAAAVTQATSLSSTVDAAFTNGQCVRGITCCPSVNASTVASTVLPSGSVFTSGSTFTQDSADTDAVIAAAFSTFSDARVSVAVGDCLIVSPISGLSLRRPASWVESARLSVITPSTDGGAVALGALQGITFLFRDEGQTPALSFGSGQRFTVLRTILGIPGFFFNAVLTTAALTSDYSQMTNARVIDEACVIAREVALPFINAKIRPTTNPTAVKGSINPATAKAINAQFSSALTQAMVPIDCVAVSAQVDQTHNLSDGVLPVSIAIQVYEYSRVINITLGLML